MNVGQKTFWEGYISFSIYSGGLKNNRVLHTFLLLLLLLVIIIIIIIYFRNGGGLESDDYSSWEYTGDKLWSQNDWHFARESVQCLDIDVVNAEEKHL